MSPYRFPRRARGVGMVDVLVGLVVIGLGVVGVTRLQAVVTRESGTAKARSTAVQLARAKLDDLKHYTQLSSGGNGVFGYDEIGNDSGGAERASGALYLPASASIDIAAVSYSRRWTSSGFYFCGSTLQQANCSSPLAAKSRPDFKALAVTVGWTDADGQARALTLRDTASSIDPLSVAIGVVSGSSSSPPIVPYVPGSAPQVIAIDVGNNEKKETTNPTPTLNKKGQTVINTIARYETIRYSGSDNTITREQFTTLNCSCAIVAGTGVAYNVRGEQVNKRRGEAADQFQAFECDICCRDHHDDASCDISSQSSSKANCFDPYRPVSDYDSSTRDHNHYTANGQLANAVGDTYVESCRMKRIDGYLRVVQDWHLLKLNAIPQSYFAPNGSPNATNLTAYGNYVKGIVAAAITGSAAPAGGWSTSVTVEKNATDQMNARGIYLDYLDATDKANWAARINAGDSTVYQTLPFYDVNMTKLAQWSSGSTAIATVSNDQLISEASGQNLYSRGLVKGISQGATTAIARVRNSNTGVINEFITSDPDDAANPQTSAISVTIPGVTYAVTGTISGLGSGANLTVSGIGAGGSSHLICTITESVSVTYSCAVPSAWSGAITPVAAGYTFTPGVYDLSNVTAAASGKNFAASGTVTADYTITGTISPALAAASLAAPGSGGSANGSCTYDPTTGAYGCTVPSGWSGSVIPSASGYSFTPGAYVASGVTSNITANFSSSISTASTYTISGTVTAAPTLAAVTISAGSGTSCTYTAASGAYSCTVPSGWSGVVTPSSDPGISFVPASYSYSVVGNNLPSQNFGTRYTISGIVGQVGSSWLTGVTFTAIGSGGSGNGSCSYPDSNGTYSCIVPGLWSGSVMPSKTGYSFAPAARTYANVTSTNITENYSATATVIPNYTISVTISGLKNSTANNATVNSFTGLSCGSATVSGSGNDRTASISCTVQQGWNGTVTPNVGSGSTLSPASNSFSNVQSNQSSSHSCSGSC